jgi:hypothetical protein
MSKRVHEDEDAALGPELGDYKEYVPLKHRWNPLLCSGDGFRSSRHPLVVQWMLRVGRCVGAYVLCGSSAPPHCVGGRLP